MSDRPKTKNGFTKPAPLPAYLKERGRFCLWKYEQRKNSKGELKWTKPPYQPKAPQYGADSTNPATFTDLGTAMNAAASFDGVGVGIFGELAAIDIDHCVSPDGTISLMAQTIIDVMDSYTEYSPSGTGIRIFFRVPNFPYSKDSYKSKYYIKNGKAHDDREKWEPQQVLEIYIAGMTEKYVTATGDVVRSADVEPRTNHIQVVLDSYMMRDAKPKAEAPRRPAAPHAPPLVDISDDELLRAAAAAKNGGSFTALYSRGDISVYPSHSEADQALFNLLAFYTGNDKERMIRLFKKSALYRPEGKPESYYSRTADTAIKSCTTFYTPPRAAQPSPPPAPPAPPAEPRIPANSISTVDQFLDKARSRDYEPIPTGIPDIDKALCGGFVRQTLVTLGASPGAGKTVLAQQIFEGIAADHEENGKITPSRGDVLYFNLEMSTEQLIARSLSRDTSIPQLDILQGYKWTQQQEYSITVAAQKYKKYVAPHISYNPPDEDGNRGSAYYQDIYRIMEAEAASRDPSRPLLVVIDYLQLLQSREKQDDVETIKSALKLFKDFAISRKAVVFLIMAHSRDINKRGTVTQGAGRDTSAIEYTGDVQLSLNYGGIVDGTYKDLDDMEKAIQTRKDGANENTYNYRALVVTKNRFGRDHAAAYMTFLGEQSRFAMLDRKHASPQGTQTKPHRVW